MGPSALRSAGTVAPRLRWVAAAAMSAALATAALPACTASGATGVGRSAAVAGTATEAPPGPPSTFPAPGPARSASAQDPLRVLVLGDDLAATAGPLAEARLEATGLADVRVEAGEGAGLVGAGDWAARWRAAVAEHRPDVVVAHLGGTGRGPWPEVDGEEAAPGTGAWFGAWNAATRDLVAAIAASGAVVYWVATPPVADRDADARAQAVNLSQQALARDYPGRIRTVDARRALSGPDGRFAVSAPQPGGDEAALRSADGYGLGPDGARLLGAAVAERLDEDWCLSAPEGCEPADRAEPVWGPAAGDPSRTRVLIVGDSLLWQVAPHLVAQLEAGGRAAVAVDARPTAGLLDGTDWSAQLAEHTARLDPDVVLVSFMGTNAADGLRGPDGTPAPPGTSGYHRLFVWGVMGVSEAAGGAGAQVLWTLGPTMANPSIEDNLRAIGYLLLWTVPALAGDRIGFVNLYPAFSHADGSYASELPSATGTPEPLRLFDGLHLTGAGASRYATTVVEHLTAEGCLDARDACRWRGPQG